ncbi:hypothetical protein V8B97DRAFT_2106043 [Scleroderma yunnanense]
MGSSNVHTLDALRSPSMLVPLSPSASAVNGPHSVLQSNSTIPIRLKDGTVDLVDPDQLFSKHTITEVRAKQLQLRADAEAKQEELRIMVGERYRELLQSSTVIITIADSAKRVQEALDEISGAIHSQQQPPAQNRVPNAHKEDSHLHTLQILSAHIKLLLDAPEQLWRLIEREKYFQAAWLFLLARVVHRALIRDDALDEESWVNQGVDVLEQFPLIQRQWESVSHFRTQIIHRATLSLRAIEKPCQETCATLLTLHILESRPLADTLTIYLSQRTKTLNTLLTKSSGTPGQSIRNGHPAEVLVSSEKSTHSQHKVSPVTVKRSVQIILEAISQTLTAAREIFGTSSTTASLAARALQHMQAESSGSSTLGNTLPSELLVNSQTVLSMLPSSTYFSLLPPNIRSYKPFVDLSSSSSSLCPKFLEEKLSGWFTQSAGGLRDTVHKAFSLLSTVDGVWRVQLALQKWISQCSLNRDELVVLSNLVDEVSKKRIMEIWKSALATTEKAFIEQLALFLPEEVTEFSPLRSIYSPLPVPVSPPPGCGPSPFESPFESLRTVLAKQLGGRTPCLQKVLGVLEDAAVVLQKDHEKVSGNDEQNCEFIQAYRPEVDVLCSNIVDALTRSADQLVTNQSSDAGLKCLIFHGRLALELSTTSSFASSIGCGQIMSENFRQRTSALFERIINYWKDYAVSSEIARYTTGITTGRLHRGSANVGPSLLTVECLHSLSSSLHDLGMAHHSLPFTRLALETISKFSDAFVHAIDEGVFLDHVQVLYDLSFLRRIISTWQNDSVELTLLDNAIVRIQSSVSGHLSQHDPVRSASETLARTQMLISALLPLSPMPFNKDSGDKMAALLPHGVAAVDAGFIPAVELAPPSARFPLLLIGNR